MQRRIGGQQKWVRKSEDRRIGRKNEDWRGGGEGGAGGRGGGGGAGGRRKKPSAPTAERWFTKMKADYDAQERSGGRFMGRRDRGMAERGLGRGSAPARAMQWRPGDAQAVPDRLEACGPRVE